MSDSAPIVSDPNGGVLIRVKAVPGASHDAIAGVLGDRLKVRVAAPPEGGKANLAICDLIAGALSLKPRDITIRSGHASAEKLLHAPGMSVADAARRLGID